MFMRFVWIAVAVVVGVLGAWTLFTLNWSYSEGERAGYVQKLSERGWICKTWEGEMAMVTMPGTVAEKFYFTVPDDEVAQEDQCDRRVTRRACTTSSTSGSPSRALRRRSTLSRPFGIPLLRHEIADRLEVLDVIADRLDDHHDRKSQHQAPTAPQPAPEQKP